MDLRLPGHQEELLEALLSTGTPVVLVLLVGRPYDISRQVGRLAAAVCGFFLGEEGAPALANVLSGRTNPSGHLPVSFPAPGGSQPATYLGAASCPAQRSEQRRPHAHFSVRPRAFFRTPDMAKRRAPLAGNVGDRRRGMHLVTLHNDDALLPLRLCSVPHDAVAEVAARPSN